MKSIREWRIERGLMGEDFERTPFANYMGSSTMEVNRDLEIELKPKLTRIMDMDNFKSIPREELFEKIKVIIAETVTEMRSGKMNPARIGSELRGEDDPSSDATKFSRMMKGSNLEADSKLRTELRPKIERIMDMEEYKSMPESELTRELIAVAAKVVAGGKGRTMSVGSIEKGLSGGMDDEPIAREDRIVPSFLAWAEQNEEGQEGSLSEPQHKQGEDNMDLKSVVEKKMMEMAMELEQAGKGSRQEVLSAMKAVVDSAAAGQGGDQGGQDAQQGQGAQPQGDQGGQPPAPSQPPSQ